MSVFRKFLLSLVVVCHGAPACNDISVAMRFDCFPDLLPTREKCESRGCCWNESHVVFGESVGMGVPACFYSSDFGYQLSDMHSGKTGLSGTLNMQSKGGAYGYDIKRLTVDMMMESETRLHVKIYDPENKRYEVPFDPPGFGTKSASLAYTVAYTKFPFGFSVTRKSTGTVIFNSTAGGFVFEDQFLQMSTVLSSSNIYGLGEHVAPLKLNMNWQRMSLFSRDRGTPEGEGHNLYGVHPFYLNMEDDGNANGVFLLNSNAMDIILQPTPAVTYRSIGGIFDFYIFLGPKPDDVIQQYAGVISSPFMPPYWGLGFHLCRWGYDNVNNTRAVVDSMRKAGIPQDTQWNDIDYMDGHKDFTYDSNKFAGLPKFVDQLHDEGMHYIVITDPGISSSQSPGSYPPYDEGMKMDVFIKDANGKPAIGRVWPGETVFPDFYHPNSSQYWKEQIKAFHDKVAFDGLWIDMNEVSNEVDGSINGCPNSKLEDPPYKPDLDGSQLRTRTLCMTAKNALSVQYNLHTMYGYSEMILTMSALHDVLGKRAMVISRSTYPSSGTFGGHWLGDNMSSWPDLYLSIPGILNFNMFGIPMVGADICGFGGNTTPELCARWMQLGAFYPFSRNHNAIHSKPQDPPSLGQDVVNASRSALLTRYSLLPYLYTLFHLAHLTGSTVARPLFFEFPTDNATLSIDQQFLWGGGLLISPVLKQGATSVVAYFPAGRWYDFYKGGEVTPSTTKVGRNVTLPASMDYVNLHVHGGHILVLQQPNLTTNASRKNPFELTVALDDQGHASGFLFWDDGDSLDTFENANYAAVNYTTEDSKLVATVESLAYQGILSLRMDKVRIFGFSKSTMPSKVQVNGRLVDKNNVLFDSTAKAVTVNNLNLPMGKGFTMEWFI